MHQRSRRRVDSLSIVLVLQAVALLLMPAAVLASHSSHFLSDDSVQNGHIYYDDNMDRYHSALKYADRQWSAEGSVQIKETPKNKNPTLKVITYAISDNLCGGWVPLSGPDRIQVNRLTIVNNRCGSNAPETVLLHEMGHALRIYDHTSPADVMDVMYKYMIRYDFQGNSWQCPLTLQSHDKHDFHYWWG